MMNNALEKRSVDDVTLPKRRIGKLKSAQDVAKYIARCIRQTEGGGDENRNYKLVMMAGILLKALEVSSLERRIDSLEERISKRSTA